MGFGSLSVEKFQEVLDKRFPKGVHLWVNLGEEEPFTAVMPRAFVLDDHTVLLSPMDDMSIYFEINVAEVDFNGKTDVILHGVNGKQYRLSPVTPRAAELLKDRVTKSYESGRVEKMREIKASELQ